MVYFYKITKKLLSDEKMLKKIFPLHIEDDDEGTYAKQVRFADDSKIVNSMIGYLNNRKWQLNAGVFDDEQRKKLSEEGLNFEEEWADTDDGKEKVFEGYKVVVDKELLTDLCSGLLMFDSKGEYKNMLYIGSQTESYPFVYFASDIIDAHCGDLIRALVKEGYIRKVKAKEKVDGRA